MRGPAPAAELPRHLLGDDLRERVAGFRQQRVLLVDRRVAGQLALERQTERRLARRPDDAAEPEELRRREDVVRARGVHAERQLVRLQPGSRDRGEMDDRVGALERVDRLAVVGQVGDQLLAFRQLRIAEQVDVDHVVAVLEQVANDRAAGLAGAAGDDHTTHRPTPTSRSYERGIRDRPDAPRGDRRSHPILARRARTRRGKACRRSAGRASPSGRRRGR